jgi:hypothetical protein
MKVHKAFVLFFSNYHILRQFAGNLNDLETGGCDASESVT